jgi:tellurite resistance protein
MNDIRETITRSAASLREKFSTSEYNLSTLFDLAILVAYADGTIDKDEMDMLGRTVRDLLDMDMSTEDLGYMVQGGVDLIQALGTEVRIKLIGQILKEQDAAEDGITLAAVIGYASEGLAASERAIIDRVAEEAGVAPERVEQIVSAVAAAAPSSLRRGERHSSTRPPPQSHES